MVGFRGFGDPARSQARWCGLRNGTLGLVPRETPLPVGIDPSALIQPASIQPDAPQAISLQSGSGPGGRLLLSQFVGVVAFAEVGVFSYWSHRHGLLRMGSRFDRLRVRDARVPHRSTQRWRWCYRIGVQTAAIIRRGVDHRWCRKGTDPVGAGVASAVVNGRIGGKVGRRTERRSVMRSVRAVESVSSKRKHSVTARKLGGGGSRCGDSGGENEHNGDKNTFHRKPQRNRMEG